MIEQNQLLALAGVGLAALLAHVAITGRAAPASRVVVGLAAATTLNQALKNLGMSVF